MFFEKNGIPFVLNETNDKEFLSELYRFCLAKEQDVLQLPITWETETTSPTSSRYGSYNFLMFPNPIVKRVYDLIKTAYFELIENQGTPKESLWIQSWMNLHRKGEYLKIHRHLGFRAHGYLSVYTEGTSTIYEIGDEDFSIQNKSGLLTLIGTDDVWHRVTPYKADNVRVSIAFDLLPNSAIENVKERMFIPFN